MHFERQLDAQQEDLARHASEINEINDGVPVGQGARSSESAHDAWVEKNLPKGGRHFPDFDGPYSAWAHKKATWVRYMIELARRKAAGVKRPTPTAEEQRTPLPRTQTHEDYPQPYEEERREAA